MKKTQVLPARRSESEANELEHRAGKSLTLERVLALQSCKVYHQVSTSHIHPGTSHLRQTCSSEYRMWIWQDRIIWLKTQTLELARCELHSTFYNVLDICQIAHRNTCSTLGWFYRGQVSPFQEEIIFLL